MTEHEWLTCEDPQRMLRLRRTDCCGAFWIAHEDGSFSVAAGYRPCALCDNGPVDPQSIFSDRQLRLFACACVRQVWHLLTDNRSRQAVEVAERYADGKATQKKLEAAGAAAWDAARAAAWDAARDAARAAAWTAAWTAAGTAAGTAARAAAWNAARDAARAAAWNAARDAARAAAWTAAWTAARAAAWTAQATLLREIMGNPYRPLPPDPTWRTPAVVHMAQVIYDDRDYDALPMLADRLEDAGLPDGDLLRHLRGFEKPRPQCLGTGKVEIPRGEPSQGTDVWPCRDCEGTGWMHLRGPHVRSCWALDYVRGVK